MLNLEQRIKIAGVKVSPFQYIDGRRVLSKATFLNFSPIDGSILCEMSAADQSDVDAAVQAAYRAFPEWAALGSTGRGEYLRRLADIIEANAEKIAQVETADNGSLLAANLHFMVKRSAHNIRFFADWAEKLQGEGWDSNGIRYKVHYDPSGVTALITPWNAPFMLTTWKVGPALAAGNPIVIKPPEWAPLTCSLLADFAEEAGIPPGVINIVQGIGEVAGAELVNHPLVNRISFTGSTDTAKIIGSAAAKRIVPVSMELGGKSPFIIFADADMDAAVSHALAQFNNAGQVCLAGTRLLVEESIEKEFLEKFSQRAKQLKLGDPRQKEIRVGPLISQEHFDRVSGFVERAKREGAKPLFGGGPSKEQGGLFFEPTLFIDVPKDAEILKKEVFGPVLTFQTFKDEEEAIRMGNDTDYGLAATVFTGEETRGERVGQKLRAGTVWVNTYYARDLKAPFGGSKQSGIGREGGTHSFDFFCDVKTLSHKMGSFYH
ncbi:aldehyde dehydrogenase [Neobacillus sp. FSL H8-0543]|uniref:aldehyde dehydrogenase n=1 Tax=Neobacillus sp. FSL H8-0543 TaxID=2954672 RepID=UPI0031592CEA